MPRIGPNHPALSRLRKLVRRSRVRDAASCGVAEGPYPVEAALDAGAAIETIFVGVTWAESGDGKVWRARLAHDASAPVHEVDDVRLRAALDASTPAPIAAVVSWRPATPDPSLADPVGPRDPWWIVACGLQDPGNLGTLWRTAEAAGAASLVRVGDGAGLRHPRTWRASMGSCFRLPAWEANAADLLRWRDRHGWKLIAADAHAGESYATYSWPERTALLLGSESRGLPTELASAVDGRVTIPLSGGVESLSVGAAAAVLAFARGGFEVRG